jgi:hypothetical protein
MKRFVAIVAGIGVGLVPVGCGSNSARSLGPAPTGIRPPSTATTPAPSHQPTTTSSSAPVTPTTAQVINYVTFEGWFVRGGKLFLATRIRPASTGVVRTALDAMLAGPTAAETAAGVSSAMPAGTQLLGVTLAGGVATVDLSGSFESGAISATMALRLAQVVYTVTQFSTATSVRFEIDGQGRTVVGGVPVQQPQTAAMYDGFLPAIVVADPPIGAKVANPVDVSGSADVFEAVVSIRILDASGSQIARTFTNATCGTGCRGTYSVSVRYAVSHQQPGTVEVFEVSAKDGSVTNVQSIPVTLTP